MKRISIRFTISVLLFCAANHVWAQQPAEVMPLADKSLILSIAKVGTSMIMVGERGHVLKSKDEGKTWQQIENVPVNITLAKVVSFNNHVWAVGHDTTIIHSKDGGETWELQFYDADREVPLLSAYFESENKGFVIGAYGTILTTEDGGANWDDGLVHEELDYHLNDITKDNDGNYYIAAEAGYAFKSVDGGLSWQEIELPYMGSMFGVVSLENEILLYGLRGNIQVSSDQGETWDEVYTDIENNLFGSSKIDGNSVLIVGANGTRIIYNDGELNIMEGEDTGDDYADVLVNGSHAVLVGETGFTNMTIQK
ncbi:MAG: YCF48-related protein [Marinicella sp.]